MKDGNFTLPPMTNLPERAPAVPYMPGEGGAAVSRRSNIQTGEETFTVEDGGDDHFQLQINVSPSGGTTFEVSTQESGQVRPTTKSTVSRDELNRALTILAGIAGPNARAAEQHIREALMILDHVDGAPPSTPLNTPLNTPDLTFPTP